MERQTGADPYSLKLKGTGIPNEDLKIRKKIDVMSPIRESTAKKSVWSIQKKQEDPIGDQIKVRKDYGTYLSVVKNATVPPNVDKWDSVTKMRLKGRGLGNR